MRHLQDDIALLELKRPVTLSDKVNLVCLPQKEAEAVPGAKCYISGNLRKLFHYITLHYVSFYFISIGR